MTFERNKKYSITVGTNRVEATLQAAYLGMHFPGSIELYFVNPIVAYRDPSSPPNHYLDGEADLRDLHYLNFTDDADDDADHLQCLPYVLLNGLPPAIPSPTPPVRTAAHEAATAWAPTPTRRAEPGAGGKRRRAQKRSGKRRSRRRLRSWVQRK